jgi:hypothetical protein
MTVAKRIAAISNLKGEIISVNHLLTEDACVASDLIEMKRWNRVSNRLGCSKFCQ